MSQMNQQPVADAGIEQSLFDTKLEFGSQSTFRMSPELQQLQERFLQAKTEKQNMGVAGSMFAMANPINPLGFLAALFLLGKLDGMEKDPLELAMEQNKNLRNEMARFAAADALTRKRKQSGEDPETNAYLRYASRELALRPYRSAMRPIRGSGDKRVIPKQQQSRESLSDGYFLTKEKQAKIREVKRQKIMLESLAAKEREEQKVTEASMLSQKLEMLDKLLRKMNGETA